MGREIRLQAMSYCSRSRFLYSAGTSYIFCRIINSRSHICFQAVRGVYNMRDRRARHEQPQHKLLTVKLTGELFKLT